MKKYFYYMALAAVILLTASCSSTKHSSKLPMVGNLTGVEYMEKVIASAPQWNSFSAKTSLELGMGSKGKTRVNATLRIRRDEVIQLSVAPMLGIEVARLELAPDGFLLVDRLHKRFVKASFTEISELLHVQLDFHVLQSLFLNELFLPSKKTLTATDIPSFLLSTQGSQAVIQTKRSQKIHYEFLTSTNQGLLEQTTVSLRNTPYALNWKYADFSDLEGRLFPSKAHVGLQGVNEPYFLNLKYSRMSVDGKWESHTKLSSRYKEIELQELIKVLLNL